MAKRIPYKPLIGIAAVACLAAVLLLRACDDRARRGGPTPAEVLSPDTTGRTAPSVAGQLDPAVGAKVDTVKGSERGSSAKGAARDFAGSDRFSATGRADGAGLNGAADTADTAATVAVRTAADYGWETGPLLGAGIPLLGAAPLGDSVVLDEKSGELVVIPKRRKHLNLLGVSIPLPGKPKKRMERGIINLLFVPRATWMGGVSASYSEHNNDDYELLRVLDWTGAGYNLQISPYFAYFYHDNNAVGGAFTYRRSFLRLDEISLNLGDDLDFAVSDVYYLEQSYSATLLQRSYVGLGSGKRIGLFNESRLTFGGGQSKVINGKGDELTGTYQTFFEMQIGIKPGIAVFIQNNVAIEAAVGILGFKYKRINQITNQVNTGTRSTSSANFKFDLFSISLGMSFYLP